MGAISNIDKGDVEVNKNTAGDVASWTVTFYRQTQLSTAQQNVEQLGLHAASLSPGASVTFTILVNASYPSTASVNPLELAKEAAAKHQNTTNGTASGSFKVEWKPVVYICGDAARMSVEECDDGNLDANDGCSSTCTIEPGWSCGGSDGQAAGIGETSRCESCKSPVVTAWSLWSDCSEACGGGGVTLRTREITSNFTGSACPTELKDQQACNPQACSSSPTPTKEPAGGDVGSDGGGGSYSSGGSYVDGNIPTATECDPSCATCNDEGQFNCISCAATHFDVGKYGIVYCALKSQRVIESTIELKGETKVTFTKEKQTILLEVLKPKISCTKGPDPCSVMIASIKDSTGRTLTEIQNLHDRQGQSRLLSSNPSIQNVLQIVVSRVEANDVALEVQSLFAGTKVQQLVLDLAKKGVFVEVTLVIPPIITSNSGVIGLIQPASPPSPEASPIVVAKSSSSTMETVVIILIVIIVLLSGAIFGMYQVGKKKSEKVKPTNHTPSGSQETEFVGDANARAPPSDEAAPSGRMHAPASLPTVQVPQGRVTLDL